MTSGEKVRSSDVRDEGMLIWLVDSDGKSSWPTDLQDCRPPSASQPVGGRRLLAYAPNRRARAERASTVTAVPPTCGYAIEGDLGAAKPDVIHAPIAAIRTGVYVLDVYDARAAPPLALASNDSVLRAGIDTFALRQFDLPHSIGPGREDR